MLWCIQHGVVIMLLVLCHLLLIQGVDGLPMPDNSRPGMGPPGMGLPSMGPGNDDGPVSLYT